MAKYNLDNYTEKDGLGFPLNFRRGNPNPLDNSSVWGSLSAAQNYAQNDPTAYVGQILSVVNYAPAEGDNTISQSTVEVYYIKDETGTLESIGTSPVGDESTITVSEDGTLSLYGIDGLELTRTDDGGSTVNITYQPLYVNGKLTWVEPSATTVEGLAAEIEGLKSRISPLETLVGGAESGLVKDVTDLTARMTDTEGDIAGVNEKIGDVEEGTTIVQMISDAQEEATYDDTELAGRVAAIESDYLKAAHKTALETSISEGDTQTLKDAKEYADSLNTSMDARVTAIATDYLKGADKTELSEAISDAEENAVSRVLGYLAEDVVNTDFDTLKEVAAWIESDTTASAELVTRVSDIEKDYLTSVDKTGLQNAIDELEVFVGALPEGTVSTTVVAYIKEAIDGLKIGDYAKSADLTALAGRVTDTETDISEVNTVLGNKVDKADGSRLMTDAEGVKLEGISEGANVNIIDSVDATQFGLEDKHLTLLDIAMGKVTGLAEALGNKVDKVAGSRLLTSDEASKLEKLVLGENGEVSVSGKVAAGNVEGLEDWITQRATTLEGLSENNLTDTLLSKLEGIAAGAQVNAIDAVSNEFVISEIGKVLNVHAIAQEKVTGLPAALAAKVDAVEGMGLSHNDFTDTLLEKLNGIAEGAEVNYVKAVSDELTVSANGTLSVESINVNKLVQTDGEYLIMNGGSSAV